MISAWRILNLGELRLIYALVDTTSGDEIVIGRHFKSADGSVAFEMAQ